MSLPSLDNALLQGTPGPQPARFLNGTDSSKPELPATARMIALADGRRLAYSEYGDANGSPLFYFHSQASSRLEGRFFHADAERAGFRVIAVDRPGIGFSDPRSGMKHSDFVDDVLALADSLDLPEFSLLAWAGGAPFAFAVAHASPKRVKLLISLAALPAQARIDPAATLGAGLTQLTQAAMRALIGLRHLLQVRHPQRYLEQLRDNICFADRKLLEDPRVSRRLLQALREGSRQGGSHVIRDASRCFDSWDFDLDAIRVPVQLWHGTADNLVPAHYSAGLAERLPNAVLKTARSRGHMFFMHGAQEILQLAAAALQDGQLNTWRNAGVTRVVARNTASHAEAQLVHSGRLPARLLHS